MGYPEETLAPEERLLLHRHPHWKMLFWPAVTFILITALAGFGAGVTVRNTDGTLQSGLLLGILVVWLLIVVWRSITPLIRWKSTHFIITDRRVLIRQGVLTHTGNDIPMNRISNVQFRHGLFDRMLGTGTLIIGSASEEPLEYDDIPHVQQVHALLYHQAFDVVQNNPNNGGGFYGSSNVYP
ncbi:PH domain-containing protein [Nocardia sp. NPDC020380]|uniref:PH domain-containing protein n=1 Tax=Nocardia sp. NPDC020380 TaxID=3364309 RepID=UPI0037BAB03E